MIKLLRKYARENPLGNRVWSSIFLCSTCLACIATGLQLFLDYRSNMSGIELRMLDIKRSYPDTLAKSMWNVDTEQIHTQIEGIANLPDIVGVQLKDAEGKLLEQAGLHKQNNMVVTEEFPIQYANDASSVHLGKLVVTASVERIYIELRNKALFILASQTAKTSLVAIFTLFIFNYLVSRHLSAFAAYAKKLDFEHLEKPLVLARPPNNNKDELDVVVSAFNEMAASLKKEYDLEKLKQQQLQNNANKLEALNKTLEEKSKQELLERNAELMVLNTKLTETNQQLKDAQEQLIQTEKLASIGQLAAGVAHEINNPIGYILSNFGTLERHLTNFIGLMQLYIYAAEKYITDIELRDWLISERVRINLDYTRDDILGILRESLEGVEQVRKIVLDLKYFSHTENDDEEWQWLDITRGLEATLNIAMSQIKNHADVIKELESLPKIQCIQSQLNQLFMNLLVNAAHAMEEVNHQGTITVRTGSTDEEVWIEVEDTGCGISKETLTHIYNPFFTTKPVGKGTGLGLSISYGIVQKHHGHINVHSEVGVGTRFRVTLPRQQPFLLGTDNG
ncbi:MAG: ATP-binding protein [Pseudomonadota bacterium]